MSPSRRRAGSREPHAGRRVGRAEPVRGEEASGRRTALMAAQMAAKTASFDMGKGDLASLTSGPVFTDKHAEQAYIKERLAAALRIFADQGFDHTIVRRAHPWLGAQTDSWK